MKDQYSLPLPSRTSAAAAAVLLICGLFIGGPAMAQNAHKKVIYSNYCSAPTQSVSGWQRDLVSDNKGLNRYYWAPISYGKHGQYTVVQGERAKQARTFHELKPQRIPFNLPPKPVQPVSTTATATSLSYGTGAQPTTALTYSYGSAYGETRVEYRQPASAEPGQKSAKKDGTVRLAVATGKLLKQ